MKSVHVALLLTPHSLHNIFDALFQVSMYTYCSVSKTFRHNCLLKIQSYQTYIIMLSYKLFKWEPDNCGGVKAYPQFQKYQLFIDRF